MSRENDEKIKRYRVAGIPIIKTIINKLGLYSLFTEHIHNYGNEGMPITDSLLLLIYNITIGRDPLYELKEWILRIAPKAHEISFSDSEMINDDRFGRALDKLYQADRASMMTSIVIKMIREFNIDTSQIHNDSTTVKACGNIPGMTKSGFKLAHGKSKDHRPDLKQLLYCLTISADGGVPVHYKLYPGNRTDDSTHIETWNTLKQLCGRTDFLYVADCKVCTHRQLSEIVGQGGHVLSIIPKTWKEVKNFKEKQKINPLKKILIWERPIPNNSKETEQFFVFKGDHFTYKNNYRIHWIFSSEKKKTDDLRRTKILNTVNKKLEELILKLNKYQLKTREQIQGKIDEIISHYKIKNLITILLEEKKKISLKQVGKGRPGINTQYKEVFTTTFVLYWEQNNEAVQQEKNLDGIFPIISTNKMLSASEALKAYKYQPHLEKRFTQFKSIHEAAPLLFKKINRIEGIMFLYFISLMIQALIERTIRTKMKENKLDFLRIYPELRKAPHPTTAQVFRLFEDISYYQLKSGRKTVKEFYDDLTKEQRQVLYLLDISEESYWRKKSKNSCF